MVLSPVLFLFPKLVTPEKTSQSPNYTIYLKHYPKIFQTNCESQSYNRKFSMINTLQKDCDINLFISNIFHFYFIFMSILFRVFKNKENRLSAHIRRQTALYKPVDAGLYLFPFFLPQTDIFLRNRKTAIELKTDEILQLTGSQRAVLSKLLQSRFLISGKNFFHQVSTERIVQKDAVIFFIFPYKCTKR